MTVKRYLIAFYIFIFLFSSFLTCCSRGGGEGSVATPEDAVTGQFLDGPVSNLDYTTNSGWSGITDTNGTFTYQPGDTITFSVGGVVLGTAQAKRYMTPIDLVPDAVDATNPVVMNICRFLLSLDEDANHEKGIEISQETKSILVDFSFDFNNRLDENPDVQSLFALLNENGIFPEDVEGGERTLVSEEDARNHFKKTLEFISAEEAAAEDIELTALIKPSGNALLIQGQSIPIEGAVVGGTPPYSYEWILKGSEVIYQGPDTPDQISSLAPGNYKLSFTATDVDGLKSSYHVLVTILESGNIPEEDEACLFNYVNVGETRQFFISLGESIRLDAEVQTGNPPFFYFWKYPETVEYSYEDNPLHATFTFNSIGTHIIDLFIKDSLNDDDRNEVVRVIVQ